MLCLGGHSCDAPVPPRDFYVTSSLEKVFTEFGVKTTPVIEVVVSTIEKEDNAEVTSNPKIGIEKTLLDLMHLTVNESETPVQSFEMAIHLPDERDGDEPFFSVTATYEM